MPKATHHQVLNVSAASLSKVIQDYAHYPEFVEGVDEVEILSTDKNSATCKYSLHIIKKFSYNIKLNHKDPNHITWEFESGDLFKKNSGEWVLKDLGKDKVDVTYNIDVEFKLFVPQMILKKLVENNLPNMFKAYESRAKGV